MAYELTQQDTREIASALAGAIAVLGDTANLSLALGLIDKSIAAVEGTPMYGMEGLAQIKQVYEEGQQHMKPLGTFRDDLASTINRWSIENDSDTPDFMLADFVIDTLAALAKAVDTREQWYGRPPVNPLGGNVTIVPPLDLDEIEPGRVIYRAPSPLAGIIPLDGVSLQRAPDAEGGAVTVSFHNPADSWALFNLIRDSMGPATGSAS